MKILYLSFILIFFSIISCSSNKPISYKSVAIDSIKVAINSDEEIKIKLFLAEKYAPGDCFGMPSVRNPRYEKKISPELLITVQNRLPNKTADEYENIIRMMERIRIEKTDMFIYNFEFADGNCCSIIHYKGKLLIMGDNIYEKDIEKTIEIVPC